MAASTSFWGLVSDAVISSSWLEKGVLGILLVMSVLTWAVIIMKLKALKQARANNERFHAVFDQAEHTGQVSEALGDEPAGPAPLQAVFVAAILARQQAKDDAEASPMVPRGQLPLRSPRQLGDRVRLAMEHAQKAEFATIGQHLSVLATAGSTSPFIGLFGTVWGILATFQTLGAAKSASLQALGPPIAAALIATAAGLAVAIPAVMLYNWLIARIDEEQEEAQSFSENLQRLLRATGAMNEPLPGAQAASATASAAGQQPVARSA